MRAFLDCEGNTVARGGDTCVSQLRPYLTTRAVAAAAAAAADEKGFTRNRNRYAYDTGNFAFSSAGGSSDLSLASPYSAGISAEIRDNK